MVWRGRRSAGASSRWIDQRVIFAPSLTRWHLIPDGGPIATPSSDLLPVRRGETPAMLKIAREEEERRGGAVLAWWGGEGAVRVLAQDGGAVLMERITGGASLAALARAGPEGDAAATRILCGAAARLHERSRVPAPPEAVPLPTWFRALEPAADRHGGTLRRAAETARALLAAPREVVVLHGDLHHENLLDAGPRGWLAIDPKGLLGERTFDYVNLLRNPDPALALAPGRFQRQVDLIAAAAGLDRTRLLQWTLAFAGLSAAWILANRDEPTLDLAVAELAAAALRSG